MDESKPKTDQPDGQPEQSEGGANNNTEGDFTLEELMRAHYKNVDLQGRRLDRPEQDD